MNFYLWRDGVEEGPFSFEQIQTAFRKGHIREGTLYRREGDQKFQPLAGIFLHLAGAAPDTNRLFTIGAIVACVGAAVYILSVYGSEGLTWVVALTLGVVVYFVPTAVARSRDHRNQDAILVLNTLLGWTFIGWVAALVWAMTREEKK